MKTTNALLAIAALLAPTSIAGHEAMLEEETAELRGGSNNISRRLGWKKDPSYYQSIYYRCCGDAGEGAQSRDNQGWQSKDFANRPSSLGLSDDAKCKCPVRGSSKGKGWFSSKTYYDKWSDSCKETGSLYNKAFN